MYASLETDVDYFDDLPDISSNDKRLIRVGATTFSQTGTYITIKLYKKDEEATFKYRQAITLSTGEFESLADNYTKIQKLTKGKNCDLTEKSKTNLKNLHARKRNAKVKTMSGSLTLITRYSFVKAMVEAVYEQSFDYSKQFHKEITNVSS